MKHKIVALFSLIFLFGSLFMKAQFNTLLPVAPKKSEVKNSFETHPQEVRGEENEQKQENSKLSKIWKSLFGSEKKVELKKEIDSLKNLMKTFEKNSKRREKYQKIKDSIWLQMQFQTKQNEAKLSQTKAKTSIEQKVDYSSKIALPLHNAMTVSSPFGVRLHPIFGIHKMHNGIDLKASYEKVYSVLDGVVSAVGWDSKGGGNYIKINHFNRFETAYLHLSEMYYKAGERVRAGFIIGRSGNSGNSTGPHLHFAVKEYGRFINPENFLNDLMNIKHLTLNKNTL